MNEDKPTGNPWMKNLLVWGGIIMVVLLVISMFNARTLLHWRRWNPEVTRNSGQRNSRSTARSA